MQQFIPSSRQSLGMLHRQPGNGVLFSPHRCMKRPRCQAVTSVTESKTQPVLSQSVVKELDSLLQQEEGEAAAIKLVQELKAQGILRAYGGVRQIPKRIYTIEELRLNSIDAAALLSPEDKSLNSVRNAGQAVAAAGVCAYAAYVGFEGAPGVLGLIFSIIFALGLDQVANQGGGESLLTDTLGRVFVRSYARRVALHEAGHFLVAYMMGLLPRAYTLSAWDAFSRYHTLNLQAGTQFCDAEFRRQVATGKLPASSLEVYACVALAGVVTEALCYGQAEGGVGDIAQLDVMLRALGFTQKKADGEVRWAVLNVASILRRHADVHAALADAMQSGASVASCVGLIEQKLQGVEDV